MPTLMAGFSSSNPFGAETSRNDNGTDAIDVGGSMAGFTGSNSLAGNDAIDDGGSLDLSFKCSSTSC